MASNVHAQGLIEVGVGMTIIHHPTPIFRLIKCMKAVMPH